MRATKKLLLLAAATAIPLLPREPLPQRIGHTDPANTPGCAVPAFVQKTSSRGRVSMAAN